MVEILKVSYSCSLKIVAGRGCSYIVTAPSELSLALASAKLAQGRARLSYGYNASKRSREARPELGRTTCLMATGQ